MKINVLSDLHLNRGAFEHPRNDADVVVLAGDIGRPAEAAAWALGFGDRPVVYVPGNHEAYGSSIEASTRELKRLCAGSRVHVLDGDEVVIGGVRFLGTTLWTDFLLFGDGSARAAAMELAQAVLRDFSYIRCGDPSSGPCFTPADAAARFERHTRWLDRRLDAPHDGPTVVVTHHAPSRRSIHPRFEGSPINACFVSDAERLAAGGRAACWVHGHTHDSFDYDLRGTRVVCNPRGYVRAGVSENPGFAPDFMIEVRAAAAAPTAR